MRILILGGTTEASALAQALASDARFDATLSLAGRTAQPRAAPIALRSGGFGGIAGLERWLADNGIAAVIDATHPYAAQISANAVAACEATGAPLGSLSRPAWTQSTGDTWRHVASATAAAETIGSAPARVFLGVGRLALADFRAAPQHAYVARTIDPPTRDNLPPDIMLVRDRGPFRLEDELRLLQRHRIEVVVSKNSGGAATFAKIEAARLLALPVIMIARPNKPSGVALGGVEEALAWLTALHSAHS